MRHEPCAESDSASDSSIARRVACRRPTRSLLWEGDSDPAPLIAREWLVANGLGGYASGTVAGVTTRRYHGLLIAAMPAPLGRMMMLNHVSELARLPDGTLVPLGGEERVASLEVYGARRLREFRLELGLPIWRYEVGPVILEKRLFMPYRQNTVHISYRIVEGQATLRLKLRPSVHFRSHDAFVSSPLPEHFELRSSDDRLELDAGPALPILRMAALDRRDTAFTIERRTLREHLYRIEESRGYDSVGDLWTPGYFRFDLKPGEEAAVVASTESWESIRALPHGERYAGELARRERLIASSQARGDDEVAAELVLAADQFLIHPAGRSKEFQQMQAVGDEARTVIAGYHWFTDWGRDTMISLEGLTLATGRHSEAGFILRTFARYVRDGLIPNMFPEGADSGVYHTADATLWYFHALDRYVEATQDRATLRLVLPTLLDIFEHHERGTRFNIQVDPRDGLLRQGAEGYQLTWMDAKLGDWVVTPRRGKAVEINALWYNALRLLGRWSSEEGESAAAARIDDAARRAYESFNARFWNEQRGHLYDVVDGPHGDDPACRPNQLFSIALPNPVLAPERWQAVVDVATARLLTPVGLRSLSPHDPNYKGLYRGDLATRDAAYHQGTTWAWLIGPYLDARARAYPEDRSGRELLLGLVAHLNDACVGSVSEVFDAEAPFHPEGCCAQAWSVAEFLRTWFRYAHGP